MDLLGKKQNSEYNLVQYKNQNFGESSYKSSNSNDNSFEKDQPFVAMVMQQQKQQKKSLYAKNKAANYEEQKMIAELSEGDTPDMKMREKQFYYKPKYGDGLRRV